MWCCKGWSLRYLPQSQCYGICGGGVKGNNAACSALCRLSVTSPTTQLGPSGVDCPVGGFGYIPGSWGSLQRTLLWGWEFLLPPQTAPPQVFYSQKFWGFSHTGTLGCVVCLAPQLFLPVYLHVNRDRPVHQPLPCPPRLSASSLLRVLSAQLPVSTPPTSLDERVLFNSLVVRLPYSSIFWQFWLFFVFKFVALLVVRGGRVYVPMPPSWPEVCFLQ